FSNGTRLRYGFQDYNLTYVWQPGNRDKLVLNGYVGDDLLKMKEHEYQADAKLQWLNAIGSLRWEHRFGPKVLLTQRVYLTHYRTRLQVSQNALDVGLPSRLTDIGYVGKLSRTWRQGSLTAGGTFTHHRLHPQYPESINIFEGINTGNPGRYTLEEFALYAEGSHRWNRLTAEVGLRYSGATHQSFYTGGLEPRARLRYELPKGRSLSLSYQLNRQYMNQVTLSGAGMPMDFWMPSTRDIPAQRIHGLDFSFAQLLHNGTYELLLEGYYRKLAHQTVFNGGLLDIFNQAYQIENHLLKGNGENYGVELMVKKNRGRWNGWVAYTLAWANRRFPELREGRLFPAKYDRRHNLNLLLRYTFNDRWNAALTYVYASGNAVTYPKGMYMIGENAVSVYDEYNSSRMPPYHRMDLSVNYRLGKQRRSSLNFSVYNVYMRHNPVLVSVHVKPSKDGKRLIIRKRNMPLYSLLPSISYIFKFGK
ncbi:MAG: TonB-dependent receptor, partial [Mediterranea sp.]|nr:TonB-dependent receptor [Mediterranea sp.]